MEYVYGPTLPLGVIDALLLTVKGEPPPVSDWLTSGTETDREADICFQTPETLFHQSANLYVPLTFTLTWAVLFDPDTLTASVKERTAAKCRH